MRRSAILSILLSAIMLTLPCVGMADTSYAEKAGNAAGVFRHEAFNFELDLDASSYVIVDFSEQMPDASFAAMRFEPLVFAITIAEDLGTELTTEQYADIVKSATIVNLSTSEENALMEDIAVLGEVMVDDVRALQLGFSGEVDGVSANYVITAFVNGTMAYQVTAFAGGVSAALVKQEADELIKAFSFIAESNAPTRQVKQVEKYESAAFAYRMSTDPGIWFPWSEFEEDYPYADIGALGA